MKNKSAVLFFLMTVIGLQFFCIFARVDHWPLTDYPMFPGIMDKDDVMIFQVTAILNNGEHIHLPHTGWPSMPNYSDSFVAKDWAGIRDQVLSDYTIAQRTDPRLAPAGIKKLLLSRMGQRLGDESLQLRDAFSISVDPQTGAFSESHD